MLSWVRENFLFFSNEKNKNALFPSGPDLNCLLDLSTDWRVSIRLHSQSMTWPSPYYYLQLSFSCSLVPHTSISSSILLSRLALFFPLLIESPADLLHWYHSVPWSSVSITTARPWPDPALAPPPFSFLFHYFSSILLFFRFSLVWASLLILWLIVLFSLSICRALLVAGFRCVSYLYL